MRLLCTLLIACSALAIPPALNPAFKGSKTPAAAGGGGGAAFSDDFSGDLSKWTEYAGDFEIFSGTCRMITGSFAQTCLAYTDETTATADQYVRVTLGADTQYPSVYLRLTDASSACYEILFDGNSGEAYLYYHATPGASGTQIGSAIDMGAALTTETIGITITGTGTSTIWRVWRDSVANLPSAANNWNGDTSPNAEWTDDPPTPVNTGNKVGWGGQQGTASTLIIDNVFAGDIP